MTYRSLASKLGFAKETIREGIVTLVKRDQTRTAVVRDGRSSPRFRPVASFVSYYAII